MLVARLKAASRELATWLAPPDAVIFAHSEPTFGMKPLVEQDALTDVIPLER